MVRQACGELNKCWLVLISYFFNYFLLNQEPHWVAHLHLLVSRACFHFSSVAPAMASSSSWPNIMHQFQGLLVIPSSPLCSVEARSLLENFISYSARKFFSLLLEPDIPEVSLPHTWWSQPQTDKFPSNNGVIALQSIYLALVFNLYRKDGWWLWLKNKTLPSDLFDWCSPLREWT